jgi:histidinol-phosphate aminotransferase
MASIADLIAPGVRGLTPYQPGKPIMELQREYGIDHVIKLASNENPLGPSPRALEAIQAALTDIARYPDGNGFGLKQALAKKLDVALSQITLGNGSNDILELVARGFVSAVDEVVFSQHAFAVYPLVTQAMGATARTAPAKNWGHDLDAMASLVNARTRVVFIANPNNPTGTWLDGVSLLSFLKALPGHVIAVVDEAYFEYASSADMGAPGYPDAVQWLAQLPRLIVTRTFSKAYGLAGLRVGYAISHPDVADVLNRVRQPFNVNSLALAAAEAALQDIDHLNRGVQLSNKGLKQLTAALTEMGLPCIPSVGNFVAVEVGAQASRIYDDLLREGVIVRPVANYGMPAHLRISVGLPEENARFVSALGKVMAARS